jgi:hypothetical protein
LSSKIHFSFVITVLLLISLSYEKSDFFKDFCFYCLIFGNNKQTRPNTADIGVPALVLAKNRFADGG